MFAVQLIVQYHTVVPGRWRRRYSDVLNSDKSMYRAQRSGIEGEQKGPQYRALRDTSVKRARFGQGTIPCYLIGVICQIQADSAMPSLVRVARRIVWFTASNAVDRLTRMRTDERDEALAARRDSVIVRRSCL